MEYPNLSLSSQSCSWLSWTHSAASAVLQLLPWVYPPSKRLTRPLISFLELMRSGREPGRAGPAPQGAAPSLFCWKSGRCPEFQAGIRAWLPGLAPRWHSWSAQGTGASSISSPGCFHVDLGSSPVWEQAASRWENPTSTRNEVFPKYLSISYLVVLPETGTEGTGGLTACAQGATPAAAGCGGSSCPTENSKGNNETQGFLLLTNPC